MMSLQQNALFILLMSLGLHACATSRIADAEISSVNGIPCFTISLTEENRNGQPLLGALSISDLSEKPAVGVWSFYMTGGKKYRSRQKAAFGMVIFLRERTACPPLNCKQDGSTAFSSMEDQMILQIPPMATWENFA
ncbi:hypothetical protein [Janthinobacterium sp. 35]|uniref:hypothetical protein n=1 Tax=Janthinobacterium sp. 35 TaxID=2035210 RepID=UPI00117B7F98|nr:hypothetical protein [Janthinobacterium sp. 35]